MRQTSPPAVTDRSRICVVPVDDEADKVIVYEPVAGVAFVGNRSMAEFSERYLTGGPIEPDLEQARRFLDDVGVRPRSTRPPPQPPSSYRPKSAVLLITNRCQLRCTYCYAAAGELSPADLSIEHAVAAIDEVVAAAATRGEDGFELSFHGGGEPTLGWSVIQEATEYARRQALVATVTLTSNGVWSPAQARWIIDNLDGLTVSVDGSPATQDCNRPFATGRGSSPVVMRNLAFLDRHDFPYGIRMTAARPWQTFEQDVQFLLEHTRCRVLRVEPAFNIARGGHGSPSSADILDFADAFLTAWDCARSVGAQLIYSGADVSAARTSFCSAPEDAYIVAPSGRVVTCYEVADDTHPLVELSTVGHVDHGLEDPTDGRAVLRSMLAARRASCRDCYCYWTCAGDCYVRAFQPGPDGHLARGRRCELNRMLTKALLLRLIAESGGVWRRHAAHRPHGLVGSRPAHRGAP